MGKGSIPGPAVWRSLCDRAVSQSVGLYPRGCHCMHVLASIVRRACAQGRVLTAQLTHAVPKTSTRTRRNITSTARKKGIHPSGRDTRHRVNTERSCNCTKTACRLRACVRGSGTTTVIQSATRPKRLSGHVHAASTWSAFLHARVLCGGLHRAAWLAANNVTPSGVRPAWPGHH
jgi:hypothetical protein